MYQYCHCCMILHNVKVYIFKHRLCVSVLEQARMLILGKYVLLGYINTTNKHGYA